MRSSLLVNVSLVGILGVICLIITQSCTTSFSNVSENTITPEVYQKFEVSFDLSESYNNPFDFNEIEVSALFINPNGDEIQVPGFWYEGYEINDKKRTVKANGYNKWMVRFTPTVEGTWSYMLLATDSTGTLDNDKRDSILGELGDILWYVANMCEELEINMGDVAQANLDKLFSRKERGVISGEGDNR